MKLTIFVSHTNPAKTEKIEMEDVSHYRFNDNGIQVIFNDESSDEVLFRANDGQGDLDWMNVTIVGTRVGMKVDMNQ